MLRTFGSSTSEMDSHKARQGLKVLRLGPKVTCYLLASLSVKPFEERKENEMVFDHQLGARLEITYNFGPEVSRLGETVFLDPHL